MKVLKTNGNVGKPCGVVITHGIGTPFNPGKSGLTQTIYVKTVQDAMRELSAPVKTVEATPVGIYFSEQLPLAGALNEVNLLCVHPNHSLSEKKEGSYHPLHYEEGMDYKLGVVTNIRLLNEENPANQITKALEMIKALSQNSSKHVLVLDNLSLDNEQLSTAINGVKSFCKKEKQELRIVLITDLPQSIGGMPAIPEHVDIYVPKKTAVKHLSLVHTAILKQASELLEGVKQPVLHPEAGKSL